jgi:hypothetical protein
MPDKVRELRQMLNEWKEDVGASKPVPNEMLNDALKK